MTVLVTSRAELDLDLAVDYYNAERPGLGDDLFTEFLAGIDRIAQHPNGWQRLDHEYRRFRLSRFPYGIIYRPEVTTQTLVVVAVMHLHRHPDSWRDR
jgi:plasmid stabilization system protein ParE